MKTEAKIRVLQPHTKETLGPPESGRDKERFLPRDFRGSAALPTP